MNADFDVRYTAGLARVDLTDEEAAKFQAQLAQVLAYVEKLNAVDISDVEPAAHGHAVFNIVREDEARPGLPPAEALANAPRQANQLFLIPKVIE